METGNSDLNLQTLGWDTLEERRIKNKLIYFQKARLNLIDVPTDHLYFKERRTRLGGDGPVYQREHSFVDGHRFSFFPDSQNLWNHLPTEVRTSDDIKSFSLGLDRINLTNLRYDNRIN